MHQIMAPRKDEFVLSHARLIDKSVRRTLPWGDDSREDAVSAGNIGLLRAFERFDPDAGFTMGTFARKFVEGEVKKVRREAASIIKTPQGEDHLNVASLSGPAYDGDGTEDTELVATISDPAHSAEKLLLREERVRRWKEDLVCALRVLTRREYRIYHARKLTAPPIQLETLAAEFGISRERARQIETAAVGKVEKHLRKIKRQVGNRPMVAPSPVPQLSFLKPDPDEQRLVKAFISKGFSEETSRALARQRDAGTEAALGLPGADDKSWRQPPQAIWRATILRIPKKQKADAKPHPARKQKPKRIVKQERQFPQGVVSSPIKINPYRAQIDEFLSKRGRK